MKLGDYVYVKPGVHDESMPADRSGLVVELLGTWGPDRRCSQVLVMFSNNAFLKFHKSQLEILGTYHTKLSLEEALKNAEE